MVRLRLVDRRSRPRYSYLQLGQAALWAKERRGDFEFLVKVRNLSTAGLFVEKQVIPSTAVRISVPSEFYFRFGTKVVKLRAIPIRDEVTKDGSFGTAYRFKNSDPHSDPRARRVIREYLKTLSEKARLERRQWIRDV